MVAARLQRKPSELEAKLTELSDRLVEEAQDLRSIVANIKKDRESGQKDEQA